MFRGVGEIVRYNAGQYGAGVATAALLLIGGTAAAQAIPWVGWIAWAGAGFTIWWVIASLAASWWIYDLSGLRKWRWLVNEVPGHTAWALVHTGLDECGYLIRKYLPECPSAIFDTYDPAIMTEPSIRRARAATATERPPDARCRWDAWPCRAHGFSHVYFVLSAHELRRSAERNVLFSECARCLKPGGTLIVVEHVRDLANFLAFGPGFFHFWPVKVWDEAAWFAGLTLDHTFRKSGFITVRVYRKQEE